jgi:hypothetical protein
MSDDRVRSGTGCIPSRFYLLKKQKRVTIYDNRIAWCRVRWGHNAQARVLLLVSISLVGGNHHGRSRTVRWRNSRVLFLTLGACDSSTHHIFYSLLGDVRMPYLASAGDKVMNPAAQLTGLHIWQDSILRPCL